MGPPEKKAEQNRAIPLNRAMDEQNAHTEKNRAENFAKDKSRGRVRRKKGNKQQHPAGMALLGIKTICQLTNR